jgi:hypothetical protein
MPSAETIQDYFGPAPHYREIATGQVKLLPFRVRMPDGSTRTNPQQWASEPAVLAASGFELTTVTQADIDAIDPPKTLNELKKEKLDLLAQTWASVLRSGFWTTLDGTTENGFFLRLETADVTLLTGAFLLLKEATAIDATATTVIVDTSETPHVVDLAQMTAVMLGYGNHRALLSSEELSFRQQVVAATTAEELAAIDFSFTQTYPANAE